MVQGLRSKVCTSDFRANHFLKKQAQAKKTISLGLVPLILFSCAVSFMPCAAVADAATVTVAWDQNSEPDIAGYKLHYGTSSQTYGYTQDVGNITTCTISDLNEGTTYYLAVTAYNSSGSESGFSKEVVHTIAVQNHQPNIPAVPSGPSSGFPNTGYDFTTSASDPDGDLLDYRFDWGDGDISDWGGAFARTHAWSSTGNFCIKAQARDTNGATSNWSGCKNINIAAANQPPIANAGDDQSARVKETVTLDGSGSYDADGNSLTFKWSFISKPGGSTTMLSSATKVNPYFVVDVPGNYIVQLIVNDSVADSQPDTVTIATQNSAPTAEAGADQTVVEGDTVKLSGAGSFDPDDNIVSYSWNQTNGPEATLTDANLTDVTFTAPAVDTDGVMLTFQLTVRDSNGLQDSDSCIVYVNNAAVGDSDNDGVPDDQDAFPSDPTESIDTDGDGIGNNADPDDDNDQMPDTWEIQYGLDPLVDDAAEDADMDGISNLDEFLADTDPTVPEGNSAPDSPILISPSDEKQVTLTPTLQTDDFYDPDYGDFHSETQWQITRQADNVCVLDVTSPNSLNSLQVPKAILKQNTRYVWKAKFFDSHGAASGWSKPAVFVAGNNPEDLDGNGIPDDQETDATSDMNEDGILDIDQETIKCVKTKGKKSQIGLSFEGSDTVTAIEYLAYQDPRSLDSSFGKPNNLPFGLIDFRLQVAKPGDQAVVTVYFSDRPPKDARWYKYDPIEGVWFDYSANTEIGANKKSITLRLKDGGMGDGDGIANGIIVDPSGLSADSAVSSVRDSNASSSSCFISAAVHESSIHPQTFFLRQRPEISLAIMLLLLILLARGRLIFRRFS
jgi:hypothetical protein